MIPLQQQGLFLPIRTSNCRSRIHLLLPRFKLLSFHRPISVKSSVYLDKLEEEEEVVDSNGGWKALKQKVEVIGIECDRYAPGEYTLLICPKCKGEKSMERSLSFHINQNENFVLWRCFNFECGWAGQVLVDRQMTVESLRLEPLGDELIEYFAERMISMEVLQKNAVMQMVDAKNVIAFPYRRDGQIVNCKYRNATSKRFWQEKGTCRIFYGLDGIKEADEIVIVEGEIDKLSMEQAGILNCVSVPDGAPQRVSTKALPSIAEDTRFKFLWNCIEYFDKASRIVLATDSDGPGQALAEELARRLGRERCWIVTWPKKDEFSCYKDANEVLKLLGAEALQDVVKRAELYQVKNLAISSSDTAMELESSSHTSNETIR